VVVGHYYAGYRIPDSWVEDLSGVYKICVQGSHGDGLLVDELLAGVQIKSNKGAVADEGLFLSVFPRVFRGLVGL